MQSAPEDSRTNAWEQVNDIRPLLPSLSRQFGSTAFARESASSSTLTPPNEVKRLRSKSRKARLSAAIALALRRSGAWVVRSTVALKGLVASAAGEASRLGPAAEPAMSDQSQQPTALLPFQPSTMTPAQLAAVSFLARYSGPTHHLYAYQLRRWFGWCESNGLDALVGIERAHIELYVRHLKESGLMASSIDTMMHGVRGYFRFAHIDGVTPSDPAVYARLPEVHRDETRTQDLDRLELIRFLQVAQTITVHHGALAYLLGINAL